MTLETVVILIVGLVLLPVGAELLIRGASRLAGFFGISPLVIGLTVVAFGTSAPELAVSVQSAFSGKTDVALGNVVGSNIFNVLLILGVCAVIVPLRVHRDLIRTDVPVMIGVSFLSLLLALDGEIGRFDGFLLFSGLLVYLTFAVRRGRREGREIRKEFEKEIDESSRAGVGAIAFNSGFVLGGLLTLVIGARLFVTASVDIARLLGVSELVIGLTIVAAGTSLPEVATSVVAALKGERDIAIGNAVGSNIFNLLIVLGLTSLVRPIGVPAAALTFDMPVMIAVAVACFPVFYTDLEISRWEGLLFVGYYVAYTLGLILATSEHSSLPVFSHIMLVFIMPITAVTLVILCAREWKKGAD